MWNYPGNKSEEFPENPPPWWLILENFQGISQEIPQKFSRIGHQFDRFFGDQILKTQFWGNPDNFSLIFP